VNTPLHFKQQLADELAAHAASLPAPDGKHAPVRLRAPRRVALTVGVAAAAAVAVTVPLASGSHGTRQAAGTPSATASTGIDIVNADYAVRSESGGTVSVELFRPQGVRSLQIALRKAGIPAAVLIPSDTCRTTVRVDRSGRGDINKVVSAGRALRASDGASQLITPSAIPKGDTLLLVARFGHKPKAMAAMLVSQVPHCVG